MKYVLENNSKKIREKKKISIAETLDFMEWSNRSLLFKKERNMVKTSIEEALKLSKLYNEPIEKIFKLRVSKKETE